MTALPSDPIRTEHRDLLPHIAELDRASIEVTQWSHEVASDRLHHIVDFLESHLLPHATAEEEILYPAIDEAMGAANATATMKVDHDEIATKVAHLRQTITEALNIWPDAQLAAAIVRQLSALHSIILLHFRKEEEVLLPVLDSTLTIKEAKALFESTDSGHTHQS